MSFQAGESGTLKKLVVCAHALLGVFMLGLLLTTRIPQPVTAAEPTPTPTPVIDEPAGLPCRLELGQDCTPADLPEFVGPRTNPLLGAREVPTYTLISATFDREMNSDTLNSDTFYVTQGAARIVGAVRFIQVSKIAIFEPTVPLRPNTTYTATLTVAVQDLRGESLPENRVWSFTTISGPARLGQGITLIGAESSGPAMQVYFGDLHSHSSYSDGQGTPAEAFATARASGIDFFALTEHDFMLTEAEWQDVLAQAATATLEGQFVAVPGFEYSNHKGHINVFDSETFVQRNDPNYDTLAEFYAWLVAHPTAFGQFNHPMKNELYDWNFNDFAFSSAVDQKIVLQELETADQFFLSLNKGWHLGTLKNHDTHQADWGCCPWMGLVASNLTRSAVLEALRARRTFFVSPSDSNLAVVMQANGYWMGSAIPNTTAINFVVNVYDPDPKGRSLRLILYDNGLPVDSTTLASATSYTWRPTVPGSLGHYYYVEAFYSGWLFPAYSSPIWVERPPTAEAGPSQTVAFGAAVTLDGSQSSDPDGDALAYRWQQESGPSVNLTEANTMLPSFTAPTSLGAISFRLTVADTGGLKASDNTVVTVTDKPILSITKSGPATTKPGEPIGYTLTVANHGAVDAFGVVITDAVPLGATYVGGGTLLPGNIVSWTVPNLPARGGTTQVSFVVTAQQGILNAKYGATCPGCIPAVGSKVLATNVRKLYFPLIGKK